MGKNITWHDFAVSRTDRETLLGQKGALVWFTGLSGSGKSTLANAVAKELHSQGKLVYVLDGDNVRHGINGDLGFSEADREENIRRITEVAKLFVDSGVIVLTAFISPFKAGRENARELLGKDFIEVFVDCPLDVCEQRDPKGLYKKARAGEIKNFTGIHQVYEAPENPELHINTAEQSVEACTDTITSFVSERYDFARKTPNVFIIGEPKCGTTALAEMLGQHPDIFTPFEKEPNYFCTDFHQESDAFHHKKLYFPFRKPDAYLPLFDPKKPFNIDASTNYAYSKVAAEKIYEFNPEAKIIYLVRNPVKLIASLHAQYVKEATEDEKDLEVAFSKQNTRKEGHGIPGRVRAPSFTYYLERIKFDEHYARYERYFPHMLVLTQEELKEDTANTLKKIESYLGVSHFAYSIGSHNARRVVRNPGLNRILRNPKAVKWANIFLPPRVRKVLKGWVVAITTKKQSPDAIDPRIVKLITDYAQPHAEAFERMTGKRVL